MKWILGLLLGLLVVDGFPVGAHLLREFGSRPANILLALVGGFLLLKRWLEQRDSLAFLVDDFRRLLLLLLIIPLLNVPIAVYFSPVSFGEVIGTWLKQYLMLIWACLSYYIWRIMLSGRNETDIAFLVVLASLPALAMFYVELLTPDNPIMAVTELLRFKEDERPSGFATEPSVYASWTLVIWPFALLLANSGATQWSRSLGWSFLAGMLASIVLCNARTAAGIGAFQVSFYLLWAFKRGRISVGTALGGLAMIAVAPFVLIKLLTVTDLQSNLSNIGRIGSTVAGILVAADYPVLGIGIGQFKYFLASYAPSFAAASDEISAWGDGSASFRASTFNLFVRLVSEFGLFAGGAACWLLFRPLSKAFFWAQTPAQLCVALSALGGFGFWLIQDQYAYQPGIFALAFLASTIDRDREAG